MVEGGEVEPFEIDVPARSRVDLVPNEESRIARDADYSVVVATDSPSLVVQRTLRASGIYRSGFATTLGSRRSATDWVVPDVVTSATRDDTIALLNPTDTPTAVSLFLNSGASGNAVPSADPLAAGSSIVRVAGEDVSIDGKAPSPLEGAQNLLLKASSRITVRLSDFAGITNGSLLVRSSAAEIVVERTATAVKRRGKRTDRPNYVLADESSLVVTTDTLPDLSVDGTSSSSGLIGASEDGLPVDDTYGVDSSVSVASAAGTGSTLIARGLTKVRQTVRFGEFFLVVQAPGPNAAQPSTSTEPTTSNAPAKGA